MILCLEEIQVFVFLQVRELGLMTKMTSLALQVPSIVMDLDLQLQQNPTWTTTCLCKETISRSHLPSSMRPLQSLQLQK